LGILAVLVAVPLALLCATFIQNSRRKQDKPDA
jgi:ABC-type phosphate transport system permease subunit